MSEMVAAALEFAEKAHRGQEDKLGVPYLHHVLTVAYSAYDLAESSGEANPTDALVLGLIHDVVEDSYFSLDDLDGIFPERIIEAADAITHRPGEPMKAYVARIVANPLAKLVKKADVAHNSLPERIAGITDEKVAARLDRKRAAYAEGGLT